jgi:hypothetical protein
MHHFFDGMRYNGKLGTSNGDGRIACSGNPAVSSGPVTFRTHIIMGLALSKQLQQNLYFASVWFVEDTYRRREVVFQVPTADIRRTV